MNHSLLLESRPSSFRAKSHGITDYDPFNDYLSQFFKFLGYPDEFSWTGLHERSENDTNSFLNYFNQRLGKIFQIILISKFFTFTFDKFMSSSVSEDESTVLEEGVVG